MANILQTMVKRWPKSLQNTSLSWAKCKTTPWRACLVLSNPIAALQWTWALARSWLCMSTYIPACVLLNIRMFWLHRESGFQESLHYKACYSRMDRNENNTCCRGKMRLGCSLAPQEKKQSLIWPTSLPPIGLIEFVLLCIYYLCSLVCVKEVVIHSSVWGLLETLGEHNTNL